MVTQPVCPSLRQSCAPADAQHKKSPRATAKLSMRRGEAFNLLNIQISGGSVGAFKFNVVSWVIHGGFHLERCIRTWPRDLQPQLQCRVRLDPRDDWQVDAIVRSPDREDGDPPHANIPMEMAGQSR